MTTTIEQLDPVLSKVDVDEEGQTHISVIIPVYNRKELIVQVLDHIYGNMDYKNFEVIIYDDASTDGSYEAVQKYPCKVIRGKTNMGPAAGRNIAASHAKGPLLLFTDSDVIMRTNALKLINRVLKGKSYNGIVGVLDPEIRFTDFASNYKNLYLHYMVKILPEEGFSFNGGLTALEHSAYADVGGFNENYSKIPCEDLELGNRLALKYRLLLSMDLMGEHLRKYTFLGCLENGFNHSQSIVKMILRERLGSPVEKQEMKVRQTAPKSFIASIGLLAFVLIFLTLALVLNPSFYFVFGFLLISIYALNSKFLHFLYKQKGLVFSLKSSLFMILDLFSMGLGVTYGAVRFFSGKKY